METIPITWTLMLITGMFVLVKAADYFTDAAEKLGAYFGASPFIIGVTIVAIGTSLPELLSSLVAVFNDASEIVIGNVVGSNIVNILLVLGVAAIASKKTIKIAYELIHVDLPLLIGSALLFAAMAWDGTFSAFEGVLTLATLVLYVHYTISTEEEHGDPQIVKEMKGEMPRKYLHWTTIAILLGSGIALYAGAKYTIESVIQLAEYLNIGTELIAISIVALGTSLPELVVSYKAARRGKPEIAVGNILGSNIFNTLAVTGIPALFVPLTVSSSILAFGLPLMLIATILYLFITQDKEITKWEGGLLIIFYIFFIWKLF